MGGRQTGSMRELVDTFKALSDETRLQIVAMLMEQDELCVCDFVGALGITQSRASRHLRYLYNAGLVEDRRETVWMHYRLSRDMDAEQKVLLDAFRHALGDDRRRVIAERLREWLQQKPAQAATDLAVARTMCLSRESD
jgi:ArsR family transcriptional regulator, arsenate/arsenite/antimonite-responsive transcriptional repressor